ncbi:hypothetical protein C9I57_10135 [Trinickia symbiotica]|uniref:Uncharacterized protein n=1 Tax=Trinickia symbiotica TaxID=863227 RepID=A0A2T3XX30_9BURK|nr:hypothetical protein [Trinickia symbiotica]PTB21066.1 hypothetical protein C9I57_10135 [Trinickia symbiotica]
MSLPPEIAPVATSWGAVIGSGIFHGVNPAMGWLFATALGLQRGSRAALFAALPPLALGHASSVFVVTSSALAFETLSKVAHLSMALGALLIAWGVYHYVYGHRHRVPIGMTAGFAGLALWSAATATLHGAGLMLIPALMPLCIAGGSAALAGTVGPLGAMGPLLAVTLVHTAVASATSAAIAYAAYEYVGLGILRRGWINFDWLWSGALVAAGAWLVGFG